MPNVPPPSQLPSRLKESSFKNYENHIALAVHDFPAVVVFESIQGSVATFVARFRDAMSSLHTYNWATITIDMDKFRACYLDLAVSHYETKAITGSRTRIREYKSKGSEGWQSNPVREGVVEPVELPNLSREEIKFLCRLASQRLLSCPIVVSGIDEENAQYFEENFDVRVDKREDGKFTIS